MKWNSPLHCLSLSLLQRIRDLRPTEADLLTWLGPEEHGRYHTLRKAGLRLVLGGRVVWSPEHLSEDGTHLIYGNRRYWIDEDRIDHCYLRRAGSEG
jgi:hypothetical protein